MSLVPMFPSSLCDPDHVHLVIWSCPVCDAQIVHDDRPGRRRIYCANACRQRAYRWRRRNQVFTTHTNARPAEAATGGTGGMGRRHALRSPRDFVARRNLGNRREEVTVCGVLARPARSPRIPHYRFTTGLLSCATCVALTTAEPTPPFEWPIPPRVWRPPLRWRDT